MKKTKKLIGVSEYASLCGGITKASVYRRLKNKEIAGQIVYVGGYPTIVIDINKFPPMPAKPRGRKKISSIKISINKK